MKILIVDSQGMALDFVLRCQIAGHEIRWYIRPLKNGDLNKIGDGFCKKVTEWESSAKWADMVFMTDNTLAMKDLDRLRRKGVPIFGATEAGADLELDRSLGQMFLRECGIDTIPFKEFTDYDAAEMYIRKTKGRYVSKPSGDADKALSYLSKTPADMIFMLRRWKKLGKQKAPFILQEFKAGVEIAIGGWIGPGGFSRWWFENFEHKKLFTGDMGPQTGEMGTLGKYTKNSLLARELLLKCEDRLTELGVTGYIDIATIMTPDGQLWPLEFTVRPGWPTFNLQVSVHEADPAEWMLDLIEGRDTLKPSEEHVAGIVLAIPDFPYSRQTKAEVQGFPITGLDEVDLEQVHFAEVMREVAPVMQGGKIVESDVPVTAGDYILIASGCGESVRAATKSAYSVLKKIQIPYSPFYRIDIGERVEKALTELQVEGLCKSWKYS